MDLKKKWEFKKFEALTNKELYGILKLRSEVFVVEQNCVFLDIDGIDLDPCMHLFCTLGDEVIACTRLLPSGISYTEASIGRVCISKSQRNIGLGKELMERSIALMEELFVKQHIKIGAQLYLKNFYASFGFEVIGDVYMEDGIKHIHMLRR